MTTLTCTQARALLMPWLDSELDATTTVSVGEHLTGCSSCAERFERESRLEQALADELRADAMPDDVWTRLQGALREAGEADGAPAPVLRPAGWNAWRWVAAAAVLLVALVLALRDPPLTVRGGLLVDAADAFRAVQAADGPRITDPVEVLALLERHGLANVRLPGSGSDIGHPVVLVGAQAEVLSGVPAVQVSYTCCDVPTSVFLVREVDLAKLPEDQRPPAVRAQLTELRVADAGLEARTITAGDVFVGVVAEDHMTLADAFRP